VSPAITARRGVDGRGGAAAPQDAAARRPYLSPPKLAVFDQARLIACKSACSAANTVILPCEHDLMFAAFCQMYAAFRRLRAASRRMFAAFWRVRAAFRPARAVFCRSFAAFRGLRAVFWRLRANRHRTFADFSGLFANTARPRVNGRRLRADG